MVKLIIAWIMLAGMLTACQTASGTFCDIADPLRPSSAVIATMSDTEVEAMLAHNEKGAELCGWKP